MFRSGHRTRLIQNYSNIGMCIEVGLLKVKVLSIFLGTVGYLPPREGR
jgi:hypothetical protein